jgi:eukaryotic-like serine/threonine-protein kinase
LTDQSQPVRIQDRYLLLERIATGGSADVWRARDEQLDRDVAVKLLHPHLLSDETSRRRLGAEGRLAASLSHPGIVQVYAVQPEGDAPALVMQLVDGESLNSRLAREGPLDPRDAASIGADVAEALFFAHKQGIVHRDVKPSNILIGSDGRARLADFGIAHSLAPAAERLTVTGMVVGTMRYISPEQLHGGDIGPRSDLYGLGAVLFEMLTGRPPFDASSPLALSEAQAAGPPELPGIDPALAQVTRACLAVSPQDRPLHAGAVAEALRSWLAGVTQPALAILPDAATATAAGSPAEALEDAVTVAVPVVAPLQPATDAAQSGSSPAPAPAAIPQRIRRLAIAVAGVLLAALLVIVVIGSGSPASGGTPTSSPSVPAWMAQLAADYAAACGGTLDLVSLQGFDQEEASDQVASLIEACGSPSESQRGKGKDHGHGRD